jgi:phospholipid-binding lipoprotein MlaA
MTTLPNRAWAGGLIAILACGALLGGCATVPRDPAARADFKAQHDPLEPLNRRIFAFNHFVDRVAVKPIAKGYVKVVPQPARDALRHLLDNLMEPVVLANNLLQGQFKRAETAGARFLVNTVAGPVGLRDVATRAGLARQSGDFGQTLYAWGVHDGPYLVLPLFGPSNPRDAIGQAADVCMDPFRYIARKQNSPTLVTTSRDVASGIDERSRNLDSLDEMQRQSIDFYAAMRSFFRQDRATVLRHDQAPSAPSADFYEDPGTAPPASNGNAGAAVSR